MDDCEEYIPSSQAANNGALQPYCAENTEISQPIQYLNSSPSAAADTVGDPIHGPLNLHRICKRLINTRQFNRLQRLRQLAVAHCVFPSASHTRLQHSLGVSHLCLELLENLQTEQRAELDLEERDIRNVAIAGLCHDLGHGPLSHAFEKEFLRRSGRRGWEHEDMSLKMFRHMVDENGIDCIESADIEFIERLIKGAKPADRARWPSGKRFLFDIVSNDQNGIDMDRADYLQRDALMCGRIRLDCNFRDLMAHARVVDDQICYPLWQLHNVWDVYRERVRLFQEVYTHRRTKAAELMAVDALMEADQALHFSVDIDDPEDFLTLDDGLLPMIEHYHRRHRKVWKLLSGAEQQALGRAQEILRRLTVGDVYDCCGECEVPARLLLDGTWEEARKGFVEQVVASYGSGLEEADVMLDENRIDYGKGGADPMVAIGFYDGDGSDCRRTSADLSLLRGPQRPECFKIRTLRLFVREPSKRAAASAAFVRWCRERLGSDVPVDTDMLDERLQRYGSGTTAASERLDDALAQRKGAVDGCCAGVGASLSPLPVTPAAKRSKTVIAATTGSEEA
ncbi:hypothetical protein PLESTB_000835600 [Pleodorina starrii]|uniref:HD/PDEase domain-containing protein n=1 Tax=Pleodorina starrii TaxID=330485 RepID=A0A9W6BLB6_9CHLO|nr:hypothetical protein PLESTM_000151300 [Pleodorina starrii]GLC54214.1 hypothetical protein PLESTB_000835600 [Pleodorina starrii]GLC64484.1 hypothetical protein PLESTF_000171200 [Pleodorina starrii]